MLSGSSSKLTFDLPSQQALATYLSNNPPIHHISLCLGIAPMTAELAFETSHAFVKHKKGEECRDVLNRFFGFFPVPKHKRSPNTIYAALVQRRAFVLRDSEDIFQHISPETCTRLVCCRAEAATVLKETCAPQWWITAMNLYDAFLSHKQPTLRIERICALDLYSHRANHRKNNRGNHRGNHNQGF